MKRLTYDAALGIVALAALASLIAGVFMLGPSEIGASWAFAVSGLRSQVGTTAPAGAVMLAATAGNVLLGSYCVRALRGVPFGSLGEALVAGLAGAVMTDLVLLATLGSTGWFHRPAILALGSLAVVSARALLGPLVVRVRAPSTSGPSEIDILNPPERVQGRREVATRLVQRLMGSFRWTPAMFGQAGWWILIVAVWAIPIIVQLASPVVPIQDVLPNHVAPVEYLRAHSTYSNLDIVPAPDYGPSRHLLGYVALLGTLTKVTGLNAALAASAFVLPLAIVVAVAGLRFARELFGAGGTWALLTIPLTFSFARLPDARGSVLAAPLLFLALTPDATVSPRRREAVCAVALGPAVYVHPLLGSMGMVLVVALALWRRSDVGIAGTAGALVLAAPQVLTMTGISLPSWILLAALPAGFGVVVAIAELGPRVVNVGRWVMLVLPAAALLRVSQVGAETANFSSTLIREYPLLVVGFLAGIWVLRRRPARVVLLIGVAVSWAFAVAVTFLPKSGVFYDGIRSEVEGKTLQYWAPLFLAVGAAGFLGALWERSLGGRWARISVLALVVLMVLPVNSAPTDALRNEEKRISEQLSIALDKAERGAFVNWPDSRLVVDASGRRLLAQLVDEQQDGCLGPHDRVLHVSAGSQSWASIPVAPFTGAIETRATLKPERSSHTLGGRLEHLLALPGLLRNGFEVVVLEPAELGPWVRRMIVRAGYESWYSNARGELFRRAPCIDLPDGS